MSSRPPGLDSRRTADWARARARAARAHHPDLGGDSESYLEALRQVDRRYGVTSADAPHVAIHRSGAPSARARRALRASRRRARSLSRHLPDRFRPGRTYIEI